MPPYQFSPASGNAPVKLLQPGVSAYAFGSRDSSFPTTVMSVTNVALTGNVATVTVKVREGKIPAVGSLISIVGTTVGAGVFNVTNVAIATVTIDAVTGIGTITFILVSGNVASAPDTGTAYVPVPEVGEALVSGASQAFAMPDFSGSNLGGRTITWSTNYPSAPATVTMNLQASMYDLDSEYVNLDTSTTTAGEIRSLNLRNYRFLRVNASGIAGGSNPSSVVRIDI